MGLQHLTGLTCVRCGNRCGLRTACPDCGPAGVLDAGYDLDDVSRRLDRRSLERREPWMWRFKELLPLDELSELPGLHVGMTPVYGAPRLAEWARLAGLWLKDEGRNPTGSLHDRSCAVAAVKARERDRRVVATASLAHAASLAALSASLDLQAVVFIAADVPDSRLHAALLAGAAVFRVEGSAEDARELCRQACSREGWADLSAGADPWLLEGAKTCGLEIGEQLAEKMPDWVVVGTGDGLALAAVHKGLVEMQRLGICASVPRLLGVQAEAEAALVAAFSSGAEDAPGARYARQALAAVRASNGAMLQVKPVAMADAVRQLATHSAVFADAAGAAGMAGLKAAVAQRIVGREQTALVVVSGGIHAAGAVSDLRPVELPAGPGALERALTSLNID